MNTVSWPWPCVLVPISNNALPLGWNRTSAYSGTGPAACSIAFARPMPRSLPRARDASRRAAKPA